MMKPQHSLLFLLALLLSLALLFFVIAPKGIYISNTVHIKCPKLTDFFDTVSPTIDTSLKDIFDLSHQMQKETVLDTIAFVPSKDSVIIRLDSLKSDTLRLLTKMFDIKNTKIQPLEFPEGKENLLSSFFNLLATGAADTSLIRIMHYGDSQIERDRVTSYLRNMFQSKFGGSGPGLLPAFQPYGKLMSVFHDASPNWKRFTTFGKVDRSLGHHRYGPMAAVSRMERMPNQNDSVYRASITLRKNIFAYKSIQNYSQCQLFLGNCNDTLTVQFVADGFALQTDKVVPTYLKKEKCEFPQFTQELTINITSKSSAELYGITLESKYGVVVDNIALRGSSGLEFSHIDAEHLKAIYAQLKPKLLILEFGGNIAPTLSKDYGFYGRYFFRELNYLKTILPNVPFIIIGIADMSIKEGDQYVSYPNLIAIRDEMKKAAFKAGCAYWDLMGAMGGQNSMPQWVKAKPSLATKDYVHFTELGARVMGKMFCATLNKEYEDYIKNIK